MCIDKNDKLGYARIYGADGECRTLFFFAGGCEQPKHPAAGP